MSGDEMSDKAREVSAMFDDLKRKTDAYYALRDARIAAEQAFGHCPHCHEPLTEHIGGKPCTVSRMTAELVCAATDPAWLERRREGITATDIVTIAGLVTWDSPWALYHRKLGLVPERDVSWRMERGRWIEPGLAEYWRENACRADLAPGGLYRNDARIWQMATPDYRLLAPDSGVLECKSTQIRDGWGPSGTDQIPRYVRVQVLWQMDTLGVGTGHVAADIAGEFRSYIIRHQDQRHVSFVSELCQACNEISALRLKGKRFWRRLQDKEPPDLDGLEVTTDALRTLHPALGGTVELDSDRLVKAYDSNAKVMATMRAEVGHVNNLIREAMGDATEATVDGRVVFRRTIGKRAGYYVQPGETDTLRRIGKDKD